MNWQPLCKSATESRPCDELQWHCRVNIAKNILGVTFLTEISYFQQLSYHIWWGRPGESGPGNFNEPNSIIHDDFINDGSADSQIMPTFNDVTLQWESHQSESRVQTPESRPSSLRVCGSATGHTAPARAPPSEDSACQWVYAGACPARTRRRCTSTQ